MNRVAYELGYPVLATGHNLDDEVAVLFSNTLNWQVGYLARQHPVLPGREGFARKVKPFCRFYERETAAYALLRGIDYMYEECPFSVGANTIYYKELLTQVELHACEQCGQPTSAPGRCAFCRLWPEEVLSKPDATFVPLTLVAEPEPEPETVG